MKKIIAVAAIAAATACSRGGSDDRAFEWVTELPAGSVVHLRNGSGSIEVKRADGQLAQVVGGRQWRRGRARDVKFVVTQNGNEYYICAMWRNSGRCAEKGYRGKNTGGFLAMFSLFHRNSDATANFTAELPANVLVDASNSNGEVTVDGITAGVKAHSINGDVKATNVAGKISLSTTNGSLELAADSTATIDAVALTTTNGQIHAELPTNSEGAFDISTVNGDVRSDFPLQLTSKSSRGNHLSGQIGSSERTIKLRSINGSVVLTRLGASVQQ
ncbi:MAG TPA: DUF4097 family beta strand repeat-containing protein [Gemmatimonadaceae bacterium]